MWAKTSYRYTEISFYKSLTIRNSGSIELCKASNYRELPNLEGEEKVFQHIVKWQSVSSAPSLTGKKWYPSLFSSLKITPFFVAKHWLFSSKWPLFRDKTLTFQSKMNPCFCGKTLTFQPKWTRIFPVKHWTSILTPFYPNSQRWVPKYSFFLGKSWISSKNYPFFENFRTRMGVVK